MFEIITEGIQKEGSVEHKTRGGEFDVIIETANAEKSSTCTCIASLIMLDWLRNEFDQHDQKSKRF